MLHPVDTAPWIPTGGSPIILRAMPLAPGTECAPTRPPEELSLSLPSFFLNDPLGDEVEPEDDVDEDDFLCDSDELEDDGSEDVRL